VAQKWGGEGERRREREEERDRDIGRGQNIPFKDMLP
jgi:hypothetical protein